MRYKDFEHRHETGCEFVGAGDFEGDPRLGEGALGAHDALGDGRFRDQKGARDFIGGEAAEQPQRQRDARLGGQHRMTGGEHQAQQVIADVVVERIVEIRHGRFLLPGGEFTAQLLVFAFEQFTAAQMVERAVFGGGHQPGARIVRDARLRPALEGGDQSVLREFLGEADVAQQPRERGDDARRLDAPHRVDGAVDIARIYLKMSHRAF